MRPALSLVFGGVLLVGTCTAQNRYSVDTVECSADVHSAPSTFKTEIRSAKSGDLRMYGVLELRRNKEDASNKRCHVMYRLYVSEGNRPFQEVFRMPWDTDEGEIAGIELIGFSPNGGKAAANLLLAAGDGQTNRPVIFDLRSKSSKFVEMPPIEDKRPPKESCDDAPYARLYGVTDAGSILVSVPPINRCADGGHWIFNPKTGSLSQIDKPSARSTR